MKKEALILALELYVGKLLAADLTTDYLKIRQDFATKTLETTPCGKFIETCVQCLEHLATGKSSTKPDVEAYLLRHVENTPLSDGLRICLARVARSVYTLRNKRGIAHKNEIDPNEIDLSYIFHSASWIMAEFIRSASGLSMTEAAKLISQIQMPVGPLVEDIDDTRLVHFSGSDRIALLILFESHYPEKIGMLQILKSFSNRKSRSLNNRLGELIEEQLVFGNKNVGYMLTTPGCKLAREEIAKILN